MSHHSIPASRLSSIGFIVLMLLFMAMALLGQDGKPSAAKPLQPTEVQSLRLQVKQKDALLAKAALEQAQRSFQQALTDLTNEGERIKIEQGWPHDTQFNPNDLTFAPAPSPTAKKEK